MPFLLLPRQLPLDDSHFPERLALWVVLTGSVSLMQYNDKVINEWRFVVGSDARDADAIGPPSQPSLPLFAGCALLTMTVPFSIIVLYTRRPPRASGGPSIA